MLSQLSGLAIMFDSISKGLKEKALKEYEQALLMPRKKKKKAKKSALLLYNIASHANSILNY